MSERVNRGGRSLQHTGLCFGAWQDETSHAHIHHASCFDTPVRIERAPVVHGSTCMRALHLTPREAPQPKLSTRKSTRKSRVLRLDRPWCGHGATVARDKLHRMS